MKKIISVLLITVLCISMLSINAFAEDNQVQVHNYVAPDGLKYEYSLDEHGAPYQYVNGEKKYLAIPLPQLRVTDPRMIRQLNSSRESVVDISTGSKIYVKSLNLSQILEYTTPILKIDLADNTFHIHGKNFTSSARTVHMIFYYQSLIDGSWSTFAMYNRDIGSSTLNDVGLVGASDHVKLYVTQVNSMSTFNLGVGTSPY